MNGTLETRINAEDIAILNRAGVNYTERAENIIVHADRSSEFRTEADADMYAMNELANLIAKARDFGGRVVAEYVSKRHPGKGIAIVRRRDGRFAVLVFVEFDNDGRDYTNIGVFNTERQARGIANERWSHAGY